MESIIDDAKETINKTKIHEMHGDMSVDLNNVKILMDEAVEKGHRSLYYPRVLWSPFLLNGGKNLTEFCDYFEKKGYTALHKISFIYQLDYVVVLWADRTFSYMNETVL